MRIKVRILGGGDIDLELSVVLEMYEMSAWLLKWGYTYKKMDHFPISVIYVFMYLFNYLIYREGKGLPA